MYSSHRSSKSLGTLMLMLILEPKIQGSDLPYPYKLFTLLSALLPVRAVHQKNTMVQRKCSILVKSTMLNIKH